MKVTLLSYEDGGGGAGRAAFKLHRALRANGVDSWLNVRSKTTDCPTVTITRPLIRKAVGRVAAQVRPYLMRLQHSANPTLRSPAWYSLGITDDLNRSDADVLHLNFVAGLLSIEDIGRLTKPLVWRLSDMWAFSGTEHYGDDGPAARWRVGYTAASRSPSDRGPDIDRWAWRRKRRAWKRAIHIVAPSRWLGRCVSESALMHDWPVTVIPTTLDVNQFQPWPKQLARAILGLPQDAPLILFGALSGGTDPRKGRDFLEAALAKVHARTPAAEGVIFGQSEPVNPPRLGLPLHWLGHLHDDATLSLAYSAADVMVLPSRQDNLPQTGIESQSCGCPVVTFDVSGLPDVVEDRHTGYLATPFEVDDLAAGIDWVLSDQDRRERLSRCARTRAVRLWSPEVVVPQFVAVYERVMQEHRTRQ
jgi:glycosyltransferase involved in cell wall biosynthesis